MADRIVALDPEADHARLMDLALRAADYARLESGREPDDGWVRETTRDAPPGVPPEDVLLFGLEREDGALSGWLGALRGFYAPGEWYVGLLLLDPAARGQGEGARLFGHLRDMARADGARLLRIAVLEANPRARRFWEREGFTRLAKSVEGEDGHTRHVLEMDL